jgi:hypothetical protein
VVSYELRQEEGGEAWVWSSRLRLRGGRWLALPSAVEEQAPQQRSVGVRRLLNDTTAL